MIDLTGEYVPILLRLLFTFVMAQIVGHRRDCLDQVLVKQLTSLSKTGTEIQTMLECELTDIGYR